MAVRQAPARRGRTRPAGVSRTAPLHGVPLPLQAAVLTAVLVGLALVAAGIGSVDVPVARSFDVVTGHLTGHTAGLDPVQDQIIWQYRLPRVLLAALTGAGLSVAGVVLQALVLNPLADPYVLGVSSGASLGAVLVLTLGSGVAGGLGVSSAAFAGAMAAALLVFALGQRAGRLAPTRLVLAGVAVGYVLLAATSYVQLQATPDELRAVMFWMLGSVAGAAWAQIPVVAAVVGTCLVILMAYGGRLNALVTGEESAIALGVDVRRARVGLLAASSLLVGVLIAVAGGIGFVGLMIPHLVRLATGADHRRLLPLSALTGAVFLVAVDLLSRTLDRPNELPLGIFTAALGAPFFLWLLRKDRSVTAS
ncbi:FecCD family ABC transporter permease [Sphaerisporangium fuscum]|uniref:FecCD family ABC transporter permease n=1 Tax=Sphaerisporangium fuscum TaxID=2835868 RepID=UPI001BDD8C81|nr:iron ABC transporter permease [Sphaerisporangium fuscum]